MIESIRDKKILYAALDWGFGHVTRSIGIIRELISQNNEVIIACSEEQKVLFVSYFPEVQFVFLEGYNFKFSGKGTWTWDLWKQRKSFFQSIKSENDFVNNFCKSKNIELIISDHRYGFYSNEVESIFVTHQINLPLSKLYFFVRKWHEKQLKKFNDIWVLDDVNSSLAGKLSKNNRHLKLNYIGWKSRFHEKDLTEIKYDYLIVVSGPKPYSEQFIDEIKSKIDLSNKRIAVLHPNSIKFRQKNEAWDYFQANDLKQNDELFYESRSIISRCGYSTLMDLKILKKDAILIPTKGQKEQEYLKIFHSSKKAEKFQPLRFL
jgi:hypothetical protein